MFYSKPAYENTVCNLPQSQYDTKCHEFYVWALKRSIMLWFQWSQGLFNRNSFTTRALQSDSSNTSLRTEKEVYSEQTYTDTSVYIHKESMKEHDDLHNWASSIDIPAFWINLFQHAEEWFKNRIIQYVHVVKGKDWKQTTNIKEWIHVTFRSSL